MKHELQPFFISLALMATCLAYPVSSLAIERHPEFQSLTEDEQFIFETPELLGPEYPADILSYAKPFEWEYQWLTRQRAADFSVGSVSAAHFMMDNRVKLRADFEEYLEFRFTYFDESDREKESVHHIVELVAWPTRWLGISAYAEPFLYKRDEDTGLALILKPHSRHEIRFFNTYVDVLRLRRNDRKDTHIEPYLPYSRGIVGRLWSDPESGQRNFLQYALRYETRTKWLFPTEQYEYQYWAAFAGITVSQALNSQLQLNVRAEADRKFEGKQPTGTSSTITQAEAWKRDRASLLTEVEIHEIGPQRSWMLRPGLQWSHRRWYSTHGGFSYNDILPHTWLKIPAFMRGQHQDHLHLGYVMTLHTVKGPKHKLMVDDWESSTQHRLNISYDFTFAQNAVMRVLVSGDLDEFGTRRSWDGGNIQLRVYF